jgi:hypothetical protein
MVLVIVGILSLLVDIFAVQLGLSQGGPFGLKRELLLAVGIILTGAGLWFLLLKKKKS